MGAPFDRWVTLRDDFEEARLDFIRTDLWVCLTLAKIVEREYGLGDREHAERTLAAIEKGYSTLVRFFSQAKGLTAEQENELWSKFIQLGERLDWLQQFKGQP